MKEIIRLRNSIQDYEWGSRSAMAELFGQPSPSPEPQAELWMGVHPKAPSQAYFDGRWIPLPDLISQWPREILGSSVVERFRGRLPFLFKILAAEAPLSIQVHPNKAQARLGFDREERLGIARDAFQRNYRDTNHKPEILCALSDFWVLCSFRPVREISEFFDPIKEAGLNQMLTDLRKKPEKGSLKPFFRKLLSLSEAEITAISRQLLEATEKRFGEIPEAVWMRDLAGRYPGDAGILSPVILNLVKLTPGEAIFLQPGELHSYLGGLGVELMADSDNVLRGGLTSKHVDIAELMEVTTFAERRVLVIKPLQGSLGELNYVTPAEEFSLASLVVKPSAPFRSAEERNVEILICTGGRGAIRDLDRGGEFELPAGASVLVPASVSGYLLEGEATFYRATVP